MATERVKLNRETMVRRIMAWYAMADDTVRMEGAAWYPLAQVEAQEMADATGLSLETVATVISHLSPQTRWSDNLAYAWELLKNDQRGKGCMHASFDRARKSITELRPLESFGKDAHKTRAFARAILTGGQSDDVVIDTWAVRVAMRTPNTYGFRDGTLDDLHAMLKRVGVYDQIADAYRAAARRLGVPASTVQAVTWAVIRGESY